MRRNGTRLDASVRVLVQRPQQPNVALPESRVGVDLGVRRLAAVANADGAVLDQVAQSRPLDAALTELRQPAAPARAARKARDSYRDAPPRFPGCIAGSTMSARIMCTS